MTRRRRRLRARSVFESCWLGREAAAPRRRVCRRVSTAIAFLALTTIGRVSAVTVTPTITGPSLLPSAGGASRVSENGVVLCQIPGVAFCVWSEHTGTVFLPSSPTDMNEGGMVIGQAIQGNFSQAWVWTITEGLQYIGTLGGGFSTARAVNSHGAVVGRSATATGQAHAFIWTREAGMVSLGTLHGSSGAEDISDQGVVVGWSVRHDGYPYAFRWSALEGMVEIGPAGSEARVINDDGLVAGWIDHGLVDRTVFAWTATDGLTILGASAVPPRMSDAGVVVGTSSSTGSQSWAWSTSVGVVPLGLGGNFTSILGMNDAGMVVGQATLPASSQTRAWVWTPTGGTIDLGTLGGTFSGAWGVNNHGIVVGQTNTTTGAPRAFAWSAEIGMVSLGTEAAIAVAISDAGTIVGSTRVAGADHAALWTITFPPSSVAPTPVGLDVEVQPTATLPDGSTATVSLSFENVTSSGTTTVETSTSGPPPPDGFRLGQPPLYYDITTNATFSGAVTICFSWPEGALHNESTARLLHFEGGVWVDVTTSINTATNTACGRVTSLSPFVIVEPAYEFLGFAQPLLADGSASIQQTRTGRTIPVKFQLARNGQLTGVPTATITAYRLFDAASGALDTTDLTDDAGAANETSNRFRYDTRGEQYVFNLSTRGWPAPATYRVVVTVSDGGVYSVDFSLR